MSDPTTLSAIKADLKAKLERIEALEAKKAEIAREEAELAELLGDSVKPVPATPTPPLPRVRYRMTMPNPADLIPITQKGWIMSLLQEHGPMTRDELFEKMEPTGKRPADTEQLSAILSREKKDGHLALDPKTFRWSIITQQEQSP